ncbi:MAG: deoxyribonuclease V [Acidobacteriota bacterium]|nr:MAG: deoxyribonuclease V [Acidobacteriota bacterium]
MPLPRLHDWEMTPKEAIALQNRLRDRVRLQPLERPIRAVAGADISFNRFSDRIFAGIVVLGLPGLEIIESSGMRSRARFPYIPGLLSFRELPALLEAWEKLETRPDALILDGQGLAHPRRFGIACHAGLWLGIPTVGCAKSILVGKHDELGQEAGSRTPLIDKDERIGVALRTKKKVAPVFVSPGHLIDMNGAVDLVLRCLTRYRLPETTRQAHLMVNRMRMENNE